MNDTLIETIEHKNYTIEIHRDTHPLNPRRDYGPCDGVLVCFHSRYTLGDKHDFSGFEELRKHIKETEAIWLPVYMYDHSEITINTTGFSCGWDSGQVGIIFIEKANITKEYGEDWNPETEKGKEKIKKCLEAEIETYDKFLRGEVYGYIVKRMGEETDSCWGYYDKEYCISEAKGMCKYDPKDDIMFKVKELLLNMEKTINDKTRSVLLSGALDLTMHKEDSYRLPKIILTDIFQNWIDDNNKSTM